MTPEAFWARVRRGRPDECWEWDGGRGWQDYGFVGHKVMGTRLAHRIAYAFTHGVMPTIFVCHHCDNPPCCNPAHLFAGTALDNMRDASRKGRLNAPRPSLGPVVGWRIVPRPEVPRPRKRRAA